ncbi:hypothetical protein [Enterococcus nangangensis]|uniref:hypothetical protein n=1 Tax=Enterococcus nangangensis TaxID=2559926 RepID=UPI0014854986|nr:hypothetical protein [Enterococcus nangangensis]
MDALDVLDRLREELHVPFLQLKLAEKEYSEAEYQQLKTDLMNYYRDYVDHEN